MDQDKTPEDNILDNYITQLNKHLDLFNTFLKQINKTYADNLKEMQDTLFKKSP
jgi:hypothetical protein